ncbi:acyl-CoA carboxylase subunit epsilon [Microbacterium esteraromaticum]|uniref:Acyl-CoA carboxylase subunit epsilon n=1 Tax=Microbacterium esteraromaticum TaxID=57043 RepID=A0A939ISK9_9MICO|nr:acyl-CoA carboxylase subunit epsilon [Microbacterium esteraromaticum]MBN7794884.1 acyl-CoA carboxylase subunit epsilon [Microbacterium esteraromaticum]MBN8206975.1 acyl-CoA carboxylase subunit epsilon [Microbacterium esteraromaticum]MBN8417130.1 acyl-CoA carboxylase subunit epsilon [Microbacterium esteraromaticum]MBN8425759.1 acyl-CoA carboxylase subunit epsilon [Microbacterium esteraromaticum]MCA1307508.1 acyl-CoA carboxylase subunit epsilon [Microbacterium esteraromaticum]
MTEPEQTPRIEITRGQPTEEELAALIAVVSDAYVRESEEAVADVPHVSAWQRTQRALRRPLRRDIPWGRFSG